MPAVSAVMGCGPVNKGKGATHAVRSWISAISTLVTRVRASSPADDHELCCALRLAGWNLFYDPDLVYQHFMPAGRLTWSYLKRLVNGAGRGAVGTKHYVVRLSLDSREKWPSDPYAPGLARGGHHYARGANLVAIELSPLGGQRARCGLFPFPGGRLAELLRSPARFWRGRRRVSDLARSIGRSR